MEEGFNIRKKPRKV